eukprot:gb/GECH01008647.1/.p1 GENE.gb/GECH01008647.1/~~gb/GECH01008647.1/.p1  ORF type:complete len:226 (+),score=89.24 gb/GECH01008647.1/:1-678(+)
MPPKKQNKKKKDSEDESQETEMKLKKAQFRIEALERILVLRTEETQRARSELNDIKEKMGHLKTDFDKEQEERYHIASDMTRQYKAMQQELIDTIVVLEERLTDTRDKLEITSFALQETRKEKDQEIELKEKEIKEQKQKMEDMAIEFGEMLKETLEQMRERISSSSSFEESDADALNMSKLNKRIQEVVGHDVFELPGREENDYNSESGDDDDDDEKDDSDDDV